VTKDAQGNFFNRVVRKVDNTPQMLGMKKEDFKVGTRDYPDCP
jgi:branched-chain amino acid transport system substrate-binding protein